MGAQGLQVASPGQLDLMKDGEADKQKHYRALCWAARELSEADEQVLNSTVELEVSQDTPVRVLHRRAPLVRSRVRHDALLVRMIAVHLLLSCRLCKFLSLMVPCGTGRPQHEVPEAEEPPVVCAGAGDAGGHVHQGVLSWRFWTDGAECRQHSWRC